MGAFEPQAAELPRAAHGTGSHPQLHLCSSLAAAPNSAHSPMPGKGHAKLGQRGNMEFRQRRPGAGTSSSRALSTHAKPLLRRELSQAGARPAHRGRGCGLGKAEETQETWGDGRPVAWPGGGDS